MLHLWTVVWMAVLNEMRPAKWLDSLCVYFRMCIGMIWSLFQMSSNCVTLQIIDVHDCH